MALTSDSETLALIKSYQQFVVFGTAPRIGKPGKIDKFPIEPYTKRKLTVWEQPHRWMSFRDALHCTRDQEGVGLVISPPLNFLDIDGCIVDGYWNPNALELIKMFPGAYCEISMSGTGAHVIFRGDVPPHGTRCKYLGMGLENYSEKRFCALTGNCIEDHGNSVLPDHSEPGEQLAALFPPKITEVPIPDIFGAILHPRGSDDDEELIRTACARKF